MSYADYDYGGSEEQRECPDGSCYNARDLGCSSAVD